MRWAILRTDALGDTLLTLPISQSLKEKGSQHVSFVVSPRAKELFPYQGVDTHLVIQQKGKWLESFKASFKFFKENQIDHILYVGGNSAPVWAAFLLGIKNRGGLKSRWWTYLLLNKGTRQKRSEQLNHEVIANHQLLEKFGIDLKLVNAPQLKVERQFDETAKSLIADWKEKIGRDHFIMIHPGMSGHSLNWPLKFYADIIGMIEDSFPNKYFFVISQTPSDLPMVKEVIGNLHNKYQKSLVHYNGAEKGLKVTMALMKLTRLFIGPSTGTTHLANALNVPQVSFYAPIKAQHKERWGPYRKHQQNWVFSPAVNCPAEVKCLQEKCSFYECMSTIRPEFVLSEISKHLEG